MSICSPSVVWALSSEPGPIAAIEFDPFQSPHRPGAGEAEPQPAVATTPARPRDGDPDPGDFKSRVARFERDVLAKALAANRFNQRQTADALGLSYDQLRHALRRHDLLPG